MNRSHDTAPATHERTVAQEAAETMMETMKVYFNDPDLHELILSVAEERGAVLEDDCFATEESFMRAAQAALDFRSGQGRDAMKTREFNERTLAALVNVTDKYHMKENTKPTEKKVNVAFVPGSAGKVPRTRLDYLVELIENGDVETDVIALIGCERPLITKRDANSQNELERAGSAGYSQSGIEAKTEFDLLRNTAAAKFDIQDDEWTYYEGQDPRVPDGEGFQKSWRIEYAQTKEGKHIFAISAAMIGANRYYPDGKPRPRSNTGDGYRMVAEMLRSSDSQESHKALAITDAVFVPFQGPDAVAALAPYEFEIETVGYTREYANMPEWPTGNLHYIQETLSFLRKTRAARNSLQKYNQTQ